MILECDSNKYSKVVLNFESAAIFLPSHSGSMFMFLWLFGCDIQSLFQLVHTELMTVLGVFLYVRVHQLYLSAGQIFSWTDTLWARHSNKTK